MIKVNEIDLNYHLEPPFRDTVISPETIGLRTPDPNKGGPSFQNLPGGTWTPSLFPNLNPPNTIRNLTSNPEPPNPQPPTTVYSSGGQIIRVKPLDKQWTCILINGNNAGNRQTMGTMFKKRELVITWCIDSQYQSILQPYFGLPIYALNGFKTCELSEDDFA